MNNLVTIAIVGRPNVGKSALFNRICKKRISIVDEAEGITRDRLYARGELFGRPFEVIDTGGIQFEKGIPFAEEIRRQAEIAVVEADAIILVVDGVIGLTQLDEDVAKFLIKSKKKVVLAVNKIDDLSQSRLLSPFYSLGLGEPIAVSAVHGYQIAELLGKALQGVEGKGEVDKDAGIRVAIVGRPNVGKSTLVNTLLDEERCIVSPIAGTTRDHIDIDFTYEGQKYTLIDTAGIRRRKSEHDVVDKFAAIRTEDAIERADVCLLILDSMQGVTAHEKRIANAIEKMGKGCILVFNKWDLVKGFRMEHCLKAVRMQVPFLNFCPAEFISAKTGRNVFDLFKHVPEVFNATRLRLPTAKLNKFIEEAIQQYHPPMIKGKRLRVYYMTQTDVAPPRFLMFINYPELMLSSYKKYLENTFREKFNFAGTPLEFNLRGKQKQDREELTDQELNKRPAWQTYR